MTPEDEKYYETYFDLFMSTGWKQFVSDMEANHKTNSQDIFLGKTEMDYGIFKGRDQVLSQILGFEAYIKGAYDDIKAHEKNDANSV